MYVESGGDEGCERGEGVGQSDSHVSTSLLRLFLRWNKRG